MLTYAVGPAITDAIAAAYFALGCKFTTCFRHPRRFSQSAIYLLYYCFTGTTVHILTVFRHPSLYAHRTKVWVDSAPATELAKAAAELQQSCNTDSAPVSHERDSKAPEKQNKQKHMLWRLRKKCAGKQLECSFQEPCTN